MANPISLTLVVDTEKKRVVFAECNKDFVDILFSFLTLPMGTIVRLLDNNSGIGCFDKLYESVNNFDKDYLQTEACKAMLLQPRSAAEIHCEDLKININDLAPPRRIYFCENYCCFDSNLLHFSNVPDTRCRCGGLMNLKSQREKMLRGSHESDSVFLQGVARFIITDDLHVKPVTTEATLSFLQSLKIQDAGALKNSVVDVGKTEILSLLKATLKGKSPLTDVFLKSSDSTSEDDNIRQEFQPIDTYPIKVESNVATNESKATSVRLLTCKSTNKVLYLEASDDFLDQLVSFLTFPLGSIVKLLNKHSSLCCVDNLYHSVEILGDDYVKSVECKEMLISPKLAEHFGCSNQLLTIEVKDTSTKEVNRKLVNPKLPVLGTENGGGFVKKPARVMVTNDMTLSPLSNAFVIDVMKELQIPINDLAEREITFGEAEVLNLLKACLTYRVGVLNSIFYPNK